MSLSKLHIKALEDRIAELEDDNIKEIERQLRINDALWAVDVDAALRELAKKIERLEALTEADGKEIGSYRRGTGLRGENRAMMDRIEQLEAALLKIRNHPEEDGVADSMEAIARAALEGKHDAGPDGYCGKLSSKLGLQAGETE